MIVNGDGRIVGVGFNTDDTCVANSPVIDWTGETVFCSISYSAQAKNSMIAIMIARMLTTRNQPFFSSMTSIILLTFLNEIELLT